MTRVALIGYGAIGRSIVGNLPGVLRADIELAAVLMKPHQLHDAMSVLPDNVVATDQIAEVMALEPEIVVEAAGHSAVAEFAPTVLAAGCELYLLSVGALADDALRESLTQCALENGGHIGIPAGALGGFDVLMTLALAGLQSVRYRSIKPPRAWLGTPAESECDLLRLLESATVFEGNARDAALLFPKNANLAVAIAIAGAGLSKTTVELVADPHTELNVGELIARTSDSIVKVSVANSPHATNPKSSQITGLSVLAALANRCALVRYV